VEVYELKLDNEKLSTNKQSQLA